MSIRRIQGIHLPTRQYSPNTSDPNPSANQPMSKDLRHSVEMAQRSTAKFIDHHRSHSPSEPKHGVSDAGEFKNSIRTSWAWKFFTYYKERCETYEWCAWFGVWEGLSMRWMYLLISSSAFCLVIIQCTKNKSLWPASIELQIRKNKAPSDLTWTSPQVIC